MKKLIFPEDSLNTYKKYYENMVGTELQLMKRKYTPDSEHSSPDSKEAKWICYFCDFILKKLELFAVGTPLINIIEEIKNDSMMQPILPGKTESSCVKNNNDICEGYDEQNIYNAFFHNHIKEIKQCFSYQAFSTRSFGENIIVYAMNKYRLGEDELEYNKSETAKSDHLSAKWSFSYAKGIIKKVLEEYDTYFNLPSGQSSYSVFEEKVDAQVLHRREDYETALNETKDYMERNYGGTKDFWASCNAYWLESKLNLQTCPYCNRNFITVVPAGPHKMRADLDHFIPKSEYPYLAVSLYNLIPACKVCNSSQKHTKEFRVQTPSPYDFSLMDVAAFRFDSSKNRLSFRESQYSTEKEKDIVSEYDEMFGIEEIYQCHSDMARTFYEKYRNYKYFEDIHVWRKNASSLFLTREEQYRLFLGTVPDKKHVLDESLGVLKRDLLRQFWGEEILKLVEKEYDS